MSPDEQEQFTLQLNKRQLTHLRDLMSITLPPRYTRRISTDLAHAEKRVAAEDALWKQVFALCEQADIELNADAPDFSLDIASAPRLEVVRVEVDE